MASAAVVMMLDLETFRRFGHFSLEQQADDARDYSREIEYSEENMAVLERTFWEREEFFAEAFAEYCKNGNRLKENCEAVYTYIDHALNTFSNLYQ